MTVCLFGGAVEAFGGGLVEGRRKSTELDAENREDKERKRVLK